MTVLTKIFHCRNMENELKSYYNKTDWANFVRIQDSLPQLKSGSVSRRKTLKNSRNSQIQWPVVNTHFQERKVYMNKDHSHSWVRISHGLNKLVTNLNNNEETSDMQFDENALRLNASDFACRSKAKAKPQKTKTYLPALPQEPYLFGKNLDRCWNRRIFNLRLSSVEEIFQSSSWKTTSRKWWSDWILENQRQSSRTFLYCHHWTDDKWKKTMARGGGTKKRFQYCTDSSRAILYFRALQSHSRRSLIDPILQDNVFIPSDFFRYIYQKSKNQNRKNLLLRQVSYRCMKENGLTLSHQNKLSLRTISRRKWSVFFDIHNKCIEKMTERFISGELNNIFRVNFHKFLIGLTIVGKHTWQQEEERKGDIKTMLVFQE